MRPFRLIFIFTVLFALSTAIAWRAQSPLLVGWISYLNVWLADAELKAQKFTTPLRTKATTVAHQVLAGDGLYASIKEQLHSVGSICRRPEIEEPTGVKAHTSVYKWKDKQGRMHYSDKKPSEGAPIDISQTLDKKESKFTLRYQTVGAGVPGGLRDQLHYSTDKIFTLLSSGLSIENTRPIELNMTVYGQEKDYLALRHSLYPSSSSNAPGFYSLEHNLAAVLNRRQPEETSRTAIHEAAHVVIAGLYGATPRWFTEGFAEYASPITVRGQLASVKSNEYWFMVLRQLASRKGLPSLAAYWAVPSEQWEGELKAQYYATAWSVIAFMMDDTERRDNLSSYMSAMEGSYCQPLQALDLASFYPGGLTNLQLEWERWVTQSKGFTHRY